MARNKAPQPKVSPINDLTIEWWDVELPKDYPLNARKWKPDAVSKVADSIQRYGWRQPIVVDDSGVIVIGHLRRAAARKAGLAQVPVHIAAGLSPEAIRGLRLADNRTHEEAEWDMDLLQREFGELKALDFDLGVTGFSLREIDKLTVSPDPHEDDVPPVPGDPITKPGDLWIMGAHRLLCGDSTNADQVARLMDGELAGLIATDPPYGVGYANDERPHPGVAKPRVAKPRVAKDELRDNGLQQFLEAAFGAARLRQNAAWYLWHAHLTQGFFAAAAAAHVILHRQIIWVKPVLLLGRGQYHWMHEPCFMGWVEGHQPPDYAERNQTTVWNVGSVSTKERQEFNHSTPKPVELFRRPILKHLQAGEIAYEPFAGSGPQIIAAEVTGRRCFGLEIEPRYCDVIVNRWENLTGKKAELCRT